MGSARNVIPPWGGDTRLGDRVLKHVLQVLKDRSGSATLGDKETIQYDVEVLDPLEIFGNDGALSKISAVRYLLLLLLLLACCDCSAES